MNILRKIRYFLIFLSFKKKTLLCIMSVWYLSDKAGHRYTYYYNEFFKNYKNKRLNLLEIGIFRGGSIKMWSKYFKNGKIFGIDNCDVNTSGDLLCNEETLSNLNKIKNVKCFKCSQTDKIELSKKFNNFIFDIIIDDGSHFIKDQLISLGYLFKMLKPGGSYIIEDIVPTLSLQTGSWWGQKNGPLETNSSYNGGKNLWYDYFKKFGKIKDEKYFEDSTWSVLSMFKKNRNFYSEYISSEENEFLTKNIKSIEIISSGLNNKILKDLKITNLPRSKGSILKKGHLAIISKK